MSFETFLTRLKVKVTLEGHINELFWAITPTYMYGIQTKSFFFFFFLSEGGVENNVQMFQMALVLL